MSSFLLFFTLFTLLILIGQLTHNTKSNPKNNLLLSQLTVVIPFRNEERNLTVLLQSIKKQEQLPAKIILVNDHSTDASVQIVTSFEGLFLELLHLSKGEEGKKNALRYGIENSSTDYVLTLDSDVQLVDNYFVNLSKIELKEAHILPVKIQNKPFFGFFNLDYYYLYALNSGLYFLKRPFVASGANFLFKREVYNKFVQQDKNQSISSGDDQYFLNYLVAKKYAVEQNTESELAVLTTIPTTFLSIVHQRVRWIKKSSSLHILPFILGLIGVCYHVGFYVVIAFFSHYDIELLLTKIVFDCILFYPYLVKIKEQFSIFKLAIFSLLYPFWMILVGILSVFIHPKWKDRKVISR